MAVRLDAKKDGIGNIIITEDSFDYLLACLDNQKFNPTQEIQDFIDYYNNECRKILHQKYIIEAIDDNYFLTKRYKYQDSLTPWSGDDVGKVYELFKDTRIPWKPPQHLKPIGSKSYIEGKEPLGIDENGWFIVEPDPQPWLIERSLRHDFEYLTISEDGRNNRPWKEEEIENIRKIFDSVEIIPEKYNKELWKHQLSKMDTSFIEQHLRILKLKKL